MVGPSTHSRQAAADSKNHRSHAASLRPQKVEKKSAPATSAIQHVQFPKSIELGFSVNVDSQGKVLVTKVTKGGAADTAGCCSGAILISVDGKNLAGLTQSEVVARITHPLGTSNFRTFGFAFPPRQSSSGDWMVPAVKGEIGRLHVSQRQAAERSMRPRRAFDIGDEQPEAVFSESG